MDTQNSIQIKDTRINTASPLVDNNMGTAPTEDGHNGEHIGNPKPPSLSNDTTTRRVLPPGEYDAMSPNYFVRCYPTALRDYIEFFCWNCTTF